MTEERIRYRWSTPAGDAGEGYESAGKAKDAAARYLRNYGGSSAEVFETHGPPRDRTERLIGTWTRTGPRKRLEWTDSGVTDLQRVPWGVSA